MATDLRTLIREALARGGVRATPQTSAAAEFAVQQALGAHVALAAELSGQNPGRSEIEHIAAHAEARLTDLVFNEANFATVAPGATATIVTYTPPPNTLGILRYFGLGVQGPADFDVLTWQLIVGGMPVYGFDSIQGPFPGILDPLPVFWPIFGGQRVQITAFNPITSVSSVINATGLVRGTIFRPS